MHRCSGGTGSQGEAGKSDVNMGQPPRNSLGGAIQPPQAWTAVPGLSREVDEAERVSWVDRRLDVQLEPGLEYGRC